MSGKRIPLLGFLFLFIFVFVATVTVVVDNINAEVCCSIQCEIGCTPPSITGVYGLVNNKLVCVIPPNHAHACWLECACY